MSLPNQDNQLLQIKNYFLLFQFFLLNQKNICVELNIRDIYNNSKKMKIPFNNYPLNVWTNLLIDVGSIFRQVFQNNIKYIDNILITGNIKIRRIYSLKSKDEMLPKSLELGKSINIKTYFLFDYNLSYVKFNLKIRKENITPIKKGRQISPLRNENKNNLYAINDKTKKNIEFAKKIPDLTRLKNEINYELRIKPNGIGSIRNINRILGFNIIDNLETYNDVKTPKKYIIKKRDNSSRKMQRSSDKYYDKEKNSQRPKNKSINPINKNKYNKFESKNSLNNIKLPNTNNNNLMRDNNKQNEIDNAINNINRTAFHNDTLYNIGDKNIKYNQYQLKYMSYGIPNQPNLNINNTKTNNELILPKIEKNNLQLPIIKNNTANQNTNNIENNNKYGNIEIMLDSALISNSRVQAQLYDSIEEESCLINNNINSTLIDGSKMEDKIIKIDPEYNRRHLKENINFKNEFDITNSELPNISNLIHDDNNDNSNRPYTPPLSKLVPLNQSRNIKQNSNYGNVKNELKINDYKNLNNISYVKREKNEDNLIYDEIKGCYYDPKTNIYYDIKI